jgi:hypothetical protein
VRHGVFHSTDTSKRRFIGDKRRLGAGHVRARMHVCACEAVNESLIKAAAIFPVVNTLARQLTAGRWIRVPTEMNVIPRGKSRWPSHPTAAQSRWFGHCEQSRSQI